MSMSGKKEQGSDIRDHIVHENDSLDAFPLPQSLCRLREGILVTTGFWEVKKVVVVPCDKPCLKRKVMRENNLRA